MIGPITTGSRPLPAELGAFALYVTACLVSTAAHDAGVVSDRPEKPVRGSRDALTTLRTARQVSDAGVVEIALPGGAGARPDRRIACG